MGTGRYSRNQLVVLAAASVVFVGALAGAIVTSRGGDGGGGDGGGAKDAGRPTTAASGAPTTPVDPTATDPSGGSTSTPPPRGEEERAVALMRLKFEACATSQGIAADELSQVEYSAAPAPGPNVYSVTVSLPPPLASASWTVDVLAGIVTPEDSLATEFDAACNDLQ